MTHEAGDEQRSESPRRWARTPMNERVIIVTGPPGAGKSTIAAELARSQDRGVHLHTDDFWHYIVSGAVPPYEPESELQNHTVLDVVASSAFIYAAGGFTTVIDGIVGPWMLPHFRAGAVEHPEIEVHYVVLRPHPDITLARAQARTGRDALVAAQPILSLVEQFSDLGDLECHALDTSLDAVDDSYRRIAAALDAGEFRLRMT